MCHIRMAFFVCVCNVEKRKPLRPCFLFVLFPLSIISKRRISIGKPYQFRTWTLVRQNLNVENNQIFSLMRKYFISVNGNKRLGL
ncbi:hypothetical protein GHT06_018339 [Daphnia sinensis]|uniref:Uncharacterized protein n=1 Tax=Daphnia sinensis TaxID=1820382 RepID=A0AAD5PS78_9CRUS|nr:hypothetical protein GHT06_018339 [Daphnia sinensis]